MQNLISFYKQRLNLQDATFQLIDHVDATVAIVFKVSLPTGIQFILKICTRPKDFANEVYFLNYFSTILPVPRIIKVVQTEATTNGAILMECLPGTILKSKDLSVSLAYEIGSLLVRVHLNRMTGYGDLSQLDNLSPDPRINFSLKFEEALTECRDHLPSSIIEQCRHYFDTHLDLLPTVDGPCITHRDFRPGNIIVFDGKLQGIIDWSAARSSFAEEDFCFLEHGDWPMSSINKQSFFEGYASIRPIPDYTAIMPLLRINRAIAVIGFTIKQGTWQNKLSSVYQFHPQFLETFFNTL
ncbi:aminoglycoside phosphotransferase family protein [Candidatus Dependentiae bacterium]|nr:aminoglycoside phosphotransferase family protein [Candidatus Dependentiae bacterium]